MRDIPGFGIWLAMMTVMSGLAGCGPDKPAVGGGPGGRPPGTDGAIAGTDAATRPPPIQPVDGATERATTTTTGAATGCSPAPTDAAADAPTGGARDGGAGGASSSVGGAAADAATPASGGRPGSTAGTGGGGADGSGGRPASADAGSTGSGGGGGKASSSGNTGGAIAAGTGGSVVGSSGGAAATGGATSTGGTRPPSSGGAPGSGGSATTGTGGLGTGGAGTGGAGGGGTSGAPAPAPGQVAIVELLINPASTDTGREWIELVNRAGYAVSLGSLHIADAANDAAVDFGSGATVLPAGGRAVLVQSGDPTKNGGITATTAAVVGTFGTLVSLNNDADTISICLGTCSAGLVVDKAAWDATLGTGYDGHALIIDDAGKRCPAVTGFGDAGSFGSPGLANPTCP